MRPRVIRRHGDTLASLLWRQLAGKPVDETNSVTRSCGAGKMRSLPTDPAQRGSVMAFVSGCTTRPATVTPTQFSSSCSSTHCSPWVKVGVTRQSARQQRSPARTHVVATASAKTSEWPTVLTKHLGVWAGCYVHIDPANGTVLDRHAATIEIGVRGSRYSQRNTYAWADGRKEVYDFPGVIRGEELIIDSPRLAGRAWFLDEDVIMFYAAFKSNGASVYDVIRLLSPKRRARTWQVCSADKIISKIVHCEEEMLSQEDAFIDM